MGATGHDAPIDLLPLSGRPARPGDDKPTTWRMDWDRRMADISAWEVEQRRFNRLLTLGSILRRCNRATGDYGPARRWGVRDAIRRMNRLAARAGGAKVMASPAVIASLIKDVLEGLRVFNTVDKLGIPDELLIARARNIVDGLRGNYMILEFPRTTGETEPFRHMFGCRCGRCPGEWDVNEAGRDERTKKERS